MARISVADCLYKIVYRLKEAGMFGTSRPQTLGDLLKHYSLPVPSFAKPYVNTKLSLHEYNNSWTNGTGPLVGAEPVPYINFHMAEEGDWSQGYRTKSPSIYRLDIGDEMHEYSGGQWKDIIGEMRQKEKKEKEEYEKKRKEERARNPESPLPQEPSITTPQKHVEEEGYWG